MVTKEKRTLSMIHHDAVHFAAMLEGLVVLIYATQEAPDSLDRGRAENALPPAAELLVEVAHRIADSLDAHV